MRTARRNGGAPTRTQEMTMAVEHCLLPEQKDLAIQYLGGHLTEAEAAAYEKHLLDCERCWMEVRTAGEIRESGGLPALAPPARPPRTLARDAWTVLAAAAAVAMMAFG